MCNQGATNVAAVSILGATANSPHFSVDGCLVHVVYDVPHLLKSIRNNFLKYDMHIEGSVASWKHIDLFYQQDKVSPIRLAPRLTDRHVEVNNVQKMRVSLAAQVLIHSVAAGLKTRVVTNELYADAMSTASFVEQVDTMFDVLNSRRRRADKPARCAISSSGDSLNTLVTSREYGWRNGSS